MAHRQHTRYPLRTPVVFQWDDQEGQRHQAAGFSRDISPGGLFVFSPSIPPVGSAIALEVVLPVVELDSPGLRLRTDGNVVRTEESEVDPGFAVVGDFRPHVAATDLRI